MRLDLEHADEATRAALAKIARRLPTGYPTDPAAERRDAPAGPRKWAPVTAVAKAAETALRDAAQLERDAREAQELAVRALRNLGAAGASWRRIGELVGMTQQGAHGRYAAIAELPRPQLTLTGELDADVPAA